MRGNLNKNSSVFIFVKQWNKYFLWILMGSPRLHEWESSVGSQECPSVPRGIWISSFINPAWLAALARKRSSKMSDWCLSHKGFQRSVAKESSGPTSVLFLLPPIWILNPWTHTVHPSFIAAFKQNEKSFRKKIFIHIQRRFSQNKSVKQETNQLHSVPSTHPIVALFEPTLIVCFHNKGS